MTVQYLAIDTETSGLFRFKDPITGVPIPADDPSQPRLASLGLVYLDEALREVRAEEFFVSPDGWVMEAGATEANGLTTEWLAENGQPVRVALDAYAAALDAGVTVIAFNAQFDCKQLRGELRRAGMDDRFERTPNICVMRASMKLKVKKAGKPGGFPKLDDVCRHLAIEQRETHQALADARAAASIARYLSHIGMLPEGRVHYAAVPPEPKLQKPDGGKPAFDHQWPEDARLPLDGDF